MTEGRQSLEEFFAKAEDVLTDWPGSPDAMNTESANFHLFDPAWFNESLRTPPSADVAPLQRHYDWRRVSWETDAEGRVVRSTEPLLPEVWPATLAACRHSTPLPPISALSAARLCAT